jgi:hypothetical protein
MINHNQKLFIGAAIYFFAAGAPLYSCLTAIEFFISRMKRCEMIARVNDQSSCEVHFYIAAMGMAVLASLIIVVATLMLADYLSRCLSEAISRAFGDVHSTNLTAPGCDNEGPRMTKEMGQKSASA